MDEAIRGLLRDVLDAEVQEVERIVLQYTRLDLPARIVGSVKPDVALSVVADPARSRFFVLVGTAIGCYGEDGYCLGWQSEPMMHPLGAAMHAATNSLLMYCSRSSLLRIDLGDWPGLPLPTVISLCRDATYKEEICVDSSDGNIVLVGQTRIDTRPARSDRPRDTSSRTQDWIYVHTQTGVLVRRLRVFEPSILLAVDGSHAILTNRNGIERRNLKTGVLVDKFEVLGQPFGYDDEAGCVLALGSHGVVCAHAHYTTQEVLAEQSSRVRSVHYMRWSTGQRVLATTCSDRTLTVRDLAFPIHLS